MKISYLMRISVLSMFLFGFFLWAGAYNAFAHAKHPKTGKDLAVDCVKTTSKVKVDANLDEWKFAQPVEVKDKEQLFQVFKGDWTGPEDCSGTVWVMWDADFIYVAAEVKDEKLIAKQAGGPIWKNEAIEVFFSPEHISIDPGPWPHPMHYQFGLAPSGPDNKPQQWAWCHVDGQTDRAQGNVTIASKLLQPYTGYIVEASIKLSETKKLAAVVKEGNTIAFHVAIDDADSDPERDLQITWSHFEAHDQKNGFGDLKFVGPAAVSPQGKMSITWGQLKGKYR